MAAVAGRGVEAGLEQLPPLPQLRIPVQTQQKSQAISRLSAVAWPGPHHQWEHAAPQPTAPQSGCSPPVGRAGETYTLTFPRPPTGDSRSLVKRSDNPPASEATLMTGLCLQLARAQQTHQGTRQTPSELHGVPCPFTPSQEPM